MLLHRVYHTITALSTFHLLAFLGKSDVNVDYNRIVSFVSLRYLSSFRITESGLNNGLLRRLEATEMNFLRSVAGYSLKDKQQNEFSQEGLGVLTLHTKLRRNWYDQIHRMDNDRIP